MHKYLLLQDACPHPAREGPEPVMLSKLLRAQTTDPPPEDRIASSSAGCVLPGMDASYWRHGMMPRMGGFPYYPWLLYLLSSSIASPTYFAYLD